MISILNILVIKVEDEDVEKIPVVNVENVNKLKLECKVKLIIL